MSSVGESVRVFRMKGGACSNLRTVVMFTNLISNLQHRSGTRPNI